MMAGIIDVVDQALLGARRRLPIPGMTLVPRAATTARK